MRIIVDNKEILKYRGVLRPARLELNEQNRARRAALIKLDQLGQTGVTEYLPRRQRVNAVRVPFMRLLPNSRTQKIYDFYFPFTPTDISYSDMSDEVAEIDRPSSTPIVVFKSHRLMRISMEFIVAVPYDGLITDVEDSITLLRRFATSSNRSVIFFHLDSLLMRGWKYRNGPSNRPPHFNIVDLTVTARQRNAAGKITQASVSMTIVENQNPKITTVKIAPFTPLPLTPEQKTAAGSEDSKLDQVPNFSGEKDAEDYDPTQQTEE